MLGFILPAILTLLASTQEQDPIADQIISFKNKTQGPIGVMTTSSGAPVESRDAGSTLNTNIFTNKFLVDSLLHLVNERIPVRVIHPKGAGAFGYFITTHDISHVCKAEFLSEVGKVTPVAVRLSMGGTERGGSDLNREARGFAVKFYTKEGNFDIVGLNTPVFLLKDPSLFSSFLHATRKNPAIDLDDANMLWDFETLHPESLFLSLITNSDRGIPDGYRHMPGYSIHTYAIYNAAGIISYARWHFHPHGGMKYLNSTKASRLAANDPDYSARDLYRAIAKGDYPTWDVSLQIMFQKDVYNATFDPFDITKVIPESKVPLYPIGKLVLNSNPKNYFAEVEQLTFCPGNLVPGIVGGLDKTFEARQFFYKAAHRHRLGMNSDKIPINCPYRSKVFTYNRDGNLPVGDNGHDSPNYYPNSFNGPIPYTDRNRPAIPKIYEAEPNNFEQAKDYYTNQITSEERTRLVENIVSSLCRATNFLQDRAVNAFDRIHSDLAKRVARTLKRNKCKH